MHDNSDGVGFCDSNYLSVTIQFMRNIEFNHFCHLSRCVHLDGVDS